MLLIQRGGMAQLRHALRALAAAEGQACLMMPLFHAAAMPLVARRYAAH